MERTYDLYVQLLLIFGEVHRIAGNRIMDRKQKHLPTAHDLDPNLRFVQNPDYAEGLSTSLKTGIRALDENISGAVICLGDMPGVSGALIDKLIAGYEPARGALIVVPSRNGHRGNPVLWSRRFFHEIMKLEGDMGARKLASTYAEGVAEIEVEDDSAFFDIDTPETLEIARKAVS